MRKIILCSVLIFTIMSHAYSQKLNPMDITDMLSYKQFEQIKEFILTKGDTQTYCNMYNNNPHYAINGKFDVYLNPIYPIFTKDSVKDESETYNTVVLSIWDDSEYPFQYTEIKGDKDALKVYLYPVSDTMETIKEKHRKIKKYLSKIMLEINNSATL